MNTKAKLFLAEVVLAERQRQEQVEALELKRRIKAAEVQVIDNSSPHIKAGRAKDRNKHPKTYQKLVGQAEIQSIMLRCDE